MRGKFELYNAIYSETKKDIAIIFEPQLWFLLLCIHLKRQLILSTGMSAQVGYLYRKKLQVTGRRIAHRWKEHKK